MYLYALRVPSFITIAQVNMICEAHEGKTRVLIQKAKDPEWAGLIFYFFFYIHFFSLAISMNSLSVFDLQMLFPLLYIFSLS